MDKFTEQSLREEYILRSKQGYFDLYKDGKSFLNEDVIAEWWLSKFAAYKESFLKDAKELHEKFLTGNIREDVKNCKGCSCDHYILGIDDFYHDLLSKQDTQ